MLTFLHTVAVVVYVGGTLFLGAVLIPVLRRQELDAEGLRVLAGAIRIFHPVSLACLGVLVLTGAGALVPLKETLGPEYVPRLLGVLALKLFLVFVLVLVGCYQFFALGPRLLAAVRTNGDKSGGDASAKGIQLVQRLQRWSLIAAVLGGAIVYLGLRMSRMG